MIGPKNVAMYNPPMCSIRYNVNANFAASDVLDFGVPCLYATDSGPPTPPHGARRQRPIWPILTTLLPAATSHMTPTLPVDTQPPRLTRRTRVTGDTLVNTHG